MRILLVDDDPLFLKIVSTLLRSDVGPVEAAFNGEGGLKILRQMTIDVLITDLMMEGMNGIDLIKIALDEKLIASNRILVLTGEPPVSPHVDWVRRRGIHILYKPFTMTEFGEAMKIVRWVA